MLPTLDHSVTGLIPAGLEQHFIALSLFIICGSRKFCQGGPDLMFFCFLVDEGPL